MELVVAINPDPDSSLRYLIWVPLGEGRVFRTSDTWPRTIALFCYPVDRSEWPADPEVVERIPLRSCAGRGAAIDVIADRARENRSQIVFTRARGRQMVFWQAPRTQKKARPNVAVPTARAAGVIDLRIVADSRERYGYTFKTQQVSVTKQALASGDYAVLADDGAIHAAVERKGLEDLISSMIKGRLRFQMADLAALPHAAVVVEERYSQVFKQQWMRPAAVTDGIAELQIAYPTVPIIFCETRKLAEEWTYRFLGAAHAVARGSMPGESAGAPSEPVTGGKRPPSDAPKPAAVRAWARANGIEVSTKGRVPAAVRSAYDEAHH
ncbi:histone-like nucleoid-structuring protein Lsr2 [Tsukamurella sp. NPDC003166]|uniref:ERCC4 domain-containing protein n=1 Tax=Tsukamurella sp. NPDC003166 TaxID=3154444 RepID=UPI0033BDEEAF